MLTRGGEYSGSTGDDDDDGSTTTVTTHDDDSSTDSDLGSWADNPVDTSDDYDADGGSSSSSSSSSSDDNDTDSDLGSWSDDPVNTSDDYDADGGSGSGSSGDGDLTDPDNYESDLADGAEEAAGSADDYGDFDMGGLFGQDGEVTLTNDQYGEVFQNEDGELMAPDSFELDSENQEALGEFLSGGSGDEGAQPDNAGTQSPDVQARIDNLLAEQRAAYEERMAALMDNLPVPDQLGGSEGGGGLSPALGGVALLALLGGGLYVTGSNG